MEEEIVVLSPDRIGYKDRGKMKWQGLMLSDHTPALKQMSAEEVSEVLYHAYILKKPVDIQANVLKEGDFYPDVNCMVKGYSRDNIYLQLKDGQMRKVSTNLIRHVEYTNPSEWHDKHEKRADC